jgi:hypothetical protein
VPRGRSNITGVSATATAIVSKCGQISTGISAQRARPLMTAAKTQASRARALADRALS